METKPKTKENMKTTLPAKDAKHFIALTFTDKTFQEASWVVDEHFSSPDYVVGDRINSEGWLEDWTDCPDYAGIQSVNVFEENPFDSELEAILSTLPVEGEITIHTKGI